MELEEFSKYERARIIGARALQISMDAPILLKISEKELKEINYDPLKIAEKELESRILPISINKPLPMKTEEDIEKVKIEKSKISDEEKIKAEIEETKEIEESGSMNELIDTKDELESDTSFNEANSPEDIE